MQPAPVHVSALGNRHAGLARSRGLQPATRPPPPMPPLQQPPPSAPRPAAPCPRSVFGAALSTVAYCSYRALALNPDVHLTAAHKHDELAESGITAAR